MIRKILLLVLLASCTSTTDTLENIALQEADGEYSLNYYNNDEAVVSYFEKRQLQGGGYTWESLVRAGLQIEASPIIDNLEFDAEAEAL